MSFILAFINKIFRKNKSESNEFIKMCVEAYIEENNLKQNRKTKELVKSLIKTKISIENKIQEVKIANLLVLSLEEDILGQSDKIYRLQPRQDFHLMEEKKELN